MAEHARQGSSPELEIDGAVATLRLCRPARANRIEPGDLEVLMGHFRSLRDQHAQVRALVVTASGKHFSSGFDLGAIASVLETGANDAFAEMVDTLEALPQTTVCAINGGVFGGSTDLALACDFRLGVPETRMFMPAARFGLHYYASGLRRYLTRLGLNASKRLFLLAEELDARALLEIGYLTAIVPADRLQEEARALARRAARLAPLACAGMKSALNAMAANRYDPAEGARISRACMVSADLREGIAASREKRDPRFEGR
ncbi:MAG: enoyl-CoA hydratase/isomerase family protein [Rhodospirillaceae bacterium]|nr:MAG: enoyl-CoA hydratase/isomerase family protein [Rhodospirillaceae bacterium]